MLTHGNVVSAVEIFSRGLEANDGFYDGVRTLVSVPLFHAAGLVVQLLTTIRAAGTVFVMPSFDVADFLECVAAERAESLVGVPAIWKAVLEHPRFGATDTSSVRTVLYGAAPVPPELVSGLAKAFPAARLGNGYGMTEMGNATFLPHRDARDHASSVGFPTPGTDVRLDDVDHNGVGVLAVRGPQVMRGYWNQPEATAASLSDGWLRTGDLCRVDADGRISIVDRAKDVIIRGGENVYSVEVENAILACPDVVEAAVVGVPDDRLGERVAAMVVNRPGAGVTAEKLLAQLAEKLAPYKLPEYIVVREEVLPRNASGKILKDVVRKSPDWALLSPIRLTHGGTS